MKRLSVCVLALGLALGGCSSKPVAPQPKVTCPAPLPMDPELVTEPQNLLPLLDQLIWYSEPG